ncbi:MAG: A24 family peptidase [Planctomycetota bacterium]
MTAGDTHLVSLIPWIVVIAAASIGTSTDLASRRLPNWLTFPLVVTGLAFNAAVGGFAGFGEAFGAMIIVALPYVLLFVLAMGGAGDAKMMAGVGAWLGFSHGLVALACVAIAGGVLAVGVGFARGQGRALTRHLSDSTLGLLAVGRGWVPVGDLGSVLPTPSSLHRFPYGAAIFAGCTAAAFGVLTWPIS